MSKPASKNAGSIASPAIGEPSYWSRGLPGVRLGLGVAEAEDVLVGNGVAFNVAVRVCVTTSDRAVFVPSGARLATPVTDEDIRGRGVSLGRPGGGVPGRGAVTQPAMMH